MSQLRLSLALLMITVLVVLFVEFITVNCTAQCIRKAHGVPVTILVLIYEDTDCGFYHNALPCRGLG